MQAVDQALPANRNGSGSAQQGERYHQHLIDFCDTGALSVSNPCNQIISPGFHVAASEEKALLSRKLTILAIFFSGPLFVNLCDAKIDLRRQMPHVGAFSRAFSFAP